MIYINTLNKATYYTETAEEVYEIGLSFIEEAKKLLVKLEERNDTH